MRGHLWVVAVALASAPLFAQEGGKKEPVPPRFLLIHDGNLYPQDSPKAVLKSAVATIERDRVDYLAAHLLDPTFIDARISDSKIPIETIVKSIRDKHKDGPDLIKDMKKILEKGEFVETGADAATASHPEIKDRKLYFKKIGTRWFIKNERTEAKP
jgi:hypothetical protein